MLEAWDPRPMVLLERLALDIFPRPSGNLIFPSRLTSCPFLERLGEVGEIAPGGRRGAISVRVSYSPFVVVPSLHWWRC